MSLDDAAATPCTMTASDGTALQARVFEPLGPLRSSVLVAGGLGIAQRFYAPFATWLAERGHRVMTFDVRGMGLSRQPGRGRVLRGLDAAMLTWARQDFAAAVQALSNHCGGEPIALVGHSLGLHHAAMTDAATQARLRVALSVAAGSGYWRDWAAPSRRKAPLMLHRAGPLLVSPADVGMQAIGHVGAFCRSAEPLLWPRMELALG